MEHEIIYQNNIYAYIYLRSIGMLLMHIRNLVNIVWIKSQQKICISHNVFRSFTSLFSIVLLIMGVIQSPKGEK